MKLRILIAGLMMVAGALAAETGAELFQKALTQERAAGNLEEAIKLYQRVATEFASDRALVAKALVQEARCYEKLGQGKALKLYEQVARDYRDQGEPVAAANARLAVLRQGDRPVAVPATMSQRKIEFAHAADWAHYAFLQTDGQRMVYKDETTGALMVSDLSGANKRVVFKPKGSIRTALATSRDFSMVEMYQTKPDGSTSVAVVKLDGTGYRDTGIYSSCRPEFSWDNRYLIFCEGAPDPSRKLLKYSLADGQVHVIGKAPTSSFQFSPDGRFIAYDAPGGRFVMPSDGGEPQLIDEKLGHILDWTRDGRYLAISADRAGSEALWLLPLKDGRSVGDAIFVRYGSFYGFGRVTTSGALIYFSAPPNGAYAESIASLDSDGRAGNWKPLVLSGSSPSLPHIRWSPDGKEFVYATSNSAAGQTAWTARIHNIASGEEHQIFQSAATLYCVWDEQKPRLFCGEHSPNKTNIVSVSTESGLTEQLGSISSAVSLYFMNADDTAIYGRDDNSVALIRWDLATHQATTLEQIPGLLGAPMGTMSPDARWISRQQKGKIEIRPFAGGDWKLIEGPKASRELAFTPDGNWLVYRDNDATGKAGLYRVSTADGGQPERIGDFPDKGNAPGVLYIGPDGRTLIASVFSGAAFTSAELSVLENFEPKPQTAKK